MQVVFYSSAQFGKYELGIETSTLVQVILMVQFVAFFSSLLLNQIAKKYGTKQTILLSLFIWLGVILYAFFMLKTTVDFYILGFVIALVLGGTQSLSRSLYSRFIPKGKEAEYFSLYEISDKGTSILGPLLFGLTLQLTESYRIALLSIGLFFIIGFILLLKINIKKAISEAGNVLA